MNLKKKILRTFTLYTIYVTTVNTYVPNIGAPQYMTQILTAIKGEIDSYTIIVGDFNTQLTQMESSPRQKIRKHGFKCQYRPGRFNC